MNRPADPRTALPSITALLDAAAHDPRFAHFARAEVTDALRAAVEMERGRRRDAAAGPETDRDALLRQALEGLGRSRRERLSPVINATGIVLHTGLGRAPLAPAAIAAAAAAGGYCNLEFDLESGDRGDRTAQVERLLVRLTGCEAALVVNNNAAATLLVLAGLAAGREAVISRGQLIEIGGAFRLPDVMACSGCVMREIGTTNKTRLADYAEAVSDRTALLLHVHPSNYRIEGFTESPDTAALVALARRVRSQRAGQAGGDDAPFVYDDLGSGALFDDPLWRMASEPTVADSLAAGADLVSFSGDKLLGGPQAGIILGRRDALGRLRRHPLARAMRIDKLTAAALQATLELYLDPPRAMEEIPALRLLHQPPTQLMERAGRLIELLRTALPEEIFEPRASESFAGGGALPAWPIATGVAAWRLGPRRSAAEVSRALRIGTPAVVARIADNEILFDLRTIDDAELERIAAAARRAVDQPK